MLSYGYYMLYCVSLLIIYCMGYYTKGFIHAVVWVWYGLYQRLYAVWLTYDS